MQRFFVKYIQPAISVKITEEFQINYTLKKMIKSKLIGLKITPQCACNKYLNYLGCTIEI